MDNGYSISQLLRYLDEKARGTARAEKWFLCECASSEGVGCESGWGLGHRSRTGIIFVMTLSLEAFNAIAPLYEASIDGNGMPVYLGKFTARRIWEYLL